MPCGNCKDFKNELTDSDHLSQELSMPQTTHSILFVPKFHCELVGEGIALLGEQQNFFTANNLFNGRTLEQFVTQWFKNPQQE